MDSSNDKHVIFGGSGFLGQALIRRMVESMGVPPENILVVARNEGNLVATREKFKGIKIQVGDIADPYAVKKAMTFGEWVYILSAMKHVGLAEKDVAQCVQSNIVGVQNIVTESMYHCDFHEGVIFISSDKAAQPTGVYGCSKKIGEKLMEEAQRINPYTNYRVIRYGNVWGSTGSIITKWKPLLERGEEVILTDPEATRFFWTVDEAVDLIFECLDKATSAKPYIPKMKAISMGTVLEACMEVYGKSPVKIIGLQPGENKVETTDGVIFSDTCEQFTKEEFKQKFLLNG